MAITPKQAFEAVKVLWPDAVAIEKISDSIEVVYPNGRQLLVFADVKWQGARQYPPPPPPPAEYVDPVWPKDWGKEAKFSEDGEHWTHGILCGKTPLQGRWLAGSTAYTFCQVKKEQA